MGWTEDVEPANPTRTLLAHTVDPRCTEELIGRLGDLAVPVRILWGEDGRWQPLRYARRLAADIPGSEFRVPPAPGTSSWRTPPSA